MPEKEIKEIATAKKEANTEKELLEDTKRLDGEFKEHSVAEFFKKNKQMLGFYGKVRMLTMVIHEYVTNSIDACEEAHILPDIDVKIDELGKEYYEVTVTDNGPGISPANVGKAFGKLLAGTKFHRLIQSRGQQGIGAAGCTMLSQMTTGKPSKVIIGQKGKPAISLEITIDPAKNEPKLANIKEISKAFQGTAVQAKFKGVVYRDSEQGPLEYVKRTAIANPHVQLSFRDPMGQKITFKRTLNEIPKAPKAIKPHPKGITVDEIISMSKRSTARTSASFLSNDFDRMGTKALAEIKKRVRFDLNKDPKHINWDEAEEIVNAFKDIEFIAPSTDALRPIGEDRIQKSLSNILQPEYVTVLTRKAAVYAGGFPFQVEIGIAYGGLAGRQTGDERKMEIMRFANRVPLLFDAGNCALTKSAQDVDWKRYGIKNPDTSPVTVFINFISVHIPYTGAGKQAIADEEEVLEELRLALMQTGRRAGVYITRKRREQENQMKRQMFYKYIPEIARALKKLTGADETGIKNKMEKLVLEKLKLEDAEEAKKIKVENKLLDQHGAGSAVDEINEDNENNKKTKKRDKK
jgi:DNA topoisomerase-6 subunit B